MNTRKINRYKHTPSINTLEEPLTKAQCRTLAQIKVDIILYIYIGVCVCVYIYREMFTIPLTLQISRKYSNLVILGYYIHNDICNIMKLH